MDFQGCPHVCQVRFRRHRRYDLKALKKQEQIDILFNKYRLSKKQINKLTKEEDRVNKIMSLEALEKSKKRKKSLK